MSERRLGLPLAWLASLTFMGVVIAAGHHRSQLPPRLGPPPFPVGNPPSTAKRVLGRMLFFDPILSGDRGTACATCHSPAAGFADPRGASLGTDGRPLPRNAPSVANVAYVRSLFADGRAGSLEEQMLEPMLSEREMSGHVDSILTRLGANPKYRELFERAFPGEPIGLAHIARAIAAYERTLVVNDTPYDRWAEGDGAARSPAAKRGFALFQGKARCAECHAAPLFGSDDLDPIGTPDRDAAGRLIPGHDPGLSRLTGNRDDFGAFRAPSLRAAGETGPYMHNGAFRTLEDV